MPLLIIGVILLLVIGMIADSNNDTKLKAACIESDGTVVVESGRFKSCTPKESK